ncbi:MAG TPA: HD-GYP domain-containing protein [Actinomycetota bacterium]|nr:HD-GYP domain-containing protein [Actinomycetota bacterium]
MRDLPVRATLFAFAVAAAAALSIAVAGPDAWPSIAAVIGFGLLFLAADYAPVWFAHVSYSVGFVVAIAAVISIGPAPAAVAATFAAIDRELFSRKDWLPRIMINAGALALSTLVLGSILVSLGGPVGSIGAEDFPGILLPLVLGSTAFFIVNAGLVSVMVSLARRTPLREVWHSDYRRTTTMHFLFAALGVLFAALYTSISWAAVPFVVVPLFAARHAFQTAEKSRETFESTLGSMITALEAKDPYTAGHASRVSQISEMVARAYGFSESKARRVRYAALLHDVGKVTIDTRVLRKPGKLTPEEYDHMKVHSIRGAELIAEIDMLADMVDGVRHHHERVDGAGYPDGLAGEALSDVAKIIMVSDAFDSMTSTRSYRKAMPMEKAFAELRRCEGTQFAPEMIDALERAIARWGWTPAPESYVGELTARPAESVHAAHA